ncbi:MAG: PilZ domain-containing protein [Proteobacteria bacterium]|nr:PilZ domain-containing protein [Pseudomonadota bacterium]MBU4010789.1 PilZ domain-containing protein [Pseudomonadota bacterium]
MQNSTKECKVVCYVGNDGLTVLRCPKCDTTKTIDTNSQNFAFKTFKANCKCGVLIKGQIEFRRYYRKTVRLSGFYLHRETGIRGDIIVANISLMGAGFSCLGKHNLQKGDQLDITFTLDNPKRSTVTLWVEVQSINEKLVGVKRRDSEIQQPDLGFYLR